MLSRTLISLFTATVIAGGIFAAPAQAEPTGENPGPFTWQSHYILAGTTQTFSPLKTDLPAGTTLTLDEDTELEALRNDGWSLSVADNVMTVAAPRDAEYKYEIPVIVSYPDGSHDATTVLMDVDYLVDTSLTRLSARELGKLSSR